MYGWEDIQLSITKLTNEELEQLFEISKNIKKLQEKKKNLEELLILYSTKT